MSARHRHAKRLAAYRLGLADRAAGPLAHNLAVAGCLEWAWILSALSAMGASTWIPGWRLGGAE
jgi:hypothetical protein